MLTRRTFVSATAGLAAVSAVSVGRAHAEHRGSTRRSSRRNGAGDPSGEGPSANAPAIAQGLELAGGYRVAAAFAPLHGALPFVLEGHGDRFQVDVMRRSDDSDPGVFDIDGLSLFVAGGREISTAHVRERGARALGMALARRVADGASMPPLRSLSERLTAHPDGRFRVEASSDRASS